MKYLFTLCFIYFLSSLSFCLRANKPGPSKLHIVLLVGQSNMAGRAAIEKTDRKHIHRAWLWDNMTQRWAHPVPPYNITSPHRKALHKQGLNCGPSFAKTYLKNNPDVELGIICMARGGSSIEQWEKEPNKKTPQNSPPLYNTALKATNNALLRGGKIVGILWHQGEANRNNYLEYPEKLERLITTFREDLKSPKLPFIFSQLGQWNLTYENFNSMIIKQSPKLENTACISTNGLEKKDNAHFNSTSQRELGIRYATALQPLLSKNLLTPIQPSEDTTSRNTDSSNNK